MSPHMKTWVLVKGTEFNPGRSISLGQVLLHPYDPNLPLLPDGPLPLEQASVERSSQVGVKSSSRSLLELSFQLWAELDLLPVSGNVGSTYEKAHAQEWEFERLESEIMVPRVEDIQRALETEEVRAQIRRRKFDFRKRLYMITGVRIARGAKLSRMDSTAKGGNAKVLVDLTTVATAPVKVGPELEVTKENEQSYCFDGVSDFVYAYRICEVHYGKSVYAAGWNKGDTFAGGDSKGAASHDGDEDADDSNDSGGELEEVGISVEQITDSFPTSLRSDYKSIEQEDEIFITTGS